MKKILFSLFLMLLITPLLQAADDTRAGVICSIARSKITGTWSCFVSPSDSDFSSRTYTITQSGNKFYSTGETSHRIFGTIQGTDISISEVVNGEELEGYVLYAQGHLISINGKNNNGIVTVYRDSQGGIGSFNCNKQ